jgi:NDP-sugar pyrophosphorylase family protein
MMQKLSLVLLSFFLISITSFAQVREIPETVKEAFEDQYPAAEKVEYHDHIVNVKVHFVLNGENMVATYNSKGRWRDTEKEWDYDKLSTDVKDGFTKSKYADWKIVETRVVYLAGGQERYRVKVEKNDVQKKNLYFNKNGRLVEESITL